MMIDNPPAVLGELTPELKAEVGCAALWVEYKDGRWGDLHKNSEVYRSYMMRCMNGERVPIHIKTKQ